MFFFIHHRRHTVNGMQEMGLSIPFTPDADFSLMTSTSVYIGNVVHRVAVQVTEKGTKASAVTAVRMRPKCAIHNVTLVVNRPFFFCIQELRETDSDLPLFTGASRDWQS